MLSATLDTNIFVSSLLVRAGPSARLLDIWRERQFLLITSPAIIAEVRATLNYPRIRRKYAISDEDAEQLITLLEQDALVVPGTADVAGAIPDDPEDEKVLACAVEAGADLIVSGDRHLLALGAYRGIPIVTARGLLARVSQKPPTHSTPPE